MKTPKIAKVLLCLSVVAACDDAANDPVESSDRELLFDMELEDVLTLHGDFAPEMDEGEFVDAFSAPFQCSAFGHICEEMGEEGALDFIQQTSELGLTGASQEEMNDFADALSREIVANTRLDADYAEVGEGDSDDETFRAFKKTYKHYQYFDGIRTKLTYGRTNPLTSNAYGWGKLIEQKQSFFGTWSKIDEPYKLYLKLRSVHHYQNFGLGGSTEIDSPEDINSKYEGTYNAAGTDGKIYFKQYYSTPNDGWGTTISGPVEIHNYIYTHACSQGWSGSGTSSAYQCWTDSAAHF